MDNMGGDFSKVLERLMADEKFADIVAAVKSATADSSGAVNDTPTDTEKSDNDAVTTAAEMPEMPKIPPEMLSKLPQIMSMLSPATEKSATHSGGVITSDKKRLLQALKPFLGEHRRDAIDSIVNIAGIADLFGI